MSRTSRTWINQCTYCAVSHGAALREHSGDPVMADLVAVNWRQAELTERQRAIAEYAELLTVSSGSVEEGDLEPLRAAGLDEHEILEAVQVIGMFNMTNRVSSAIGWCPTTSTTARRADAQSSSASSSPVGG